MLGRIGTDMRCAIDSSSVMMSLTSAAAILYNDVLVDLSLA